MRIALFTYGTRGDVQPLLALAHGLQDVGHTVTFAAPVNFEGLVRGVGLTYAPLSGDTHDMMNSEDGQKWLASGNALKFQKHLGKLSHELRHSLQKDMLAASAGAQAILSTVLTTPFSLPLAEKLKIPLAAIYTMPLGPPSGEFANFILSSRSWRLQTINRLTHWLFEFADWQGAKADVNEWRRDLGLAPATRSTSAQLRRSRIPQIHIYSRHLFPKPADWSDEISVTGLISLKSATKTAMNESEAPADLSRWLAEGPAPIFFGLGSMVNVDPLGLLNLAREVASELKVRLIFGAGWSAVPLGFSAEVFTLGAVDYDWLFPQCAAVVHHGGAGTTGTAVRAGVPTVVCSVFADQPFWGHRIEKLGLGATVPLSALTRQSLLAALQRALRPEVKAKAVEFAGKLRQEDGLANAVAAILRALESS